MTTQTKLTVEQAQEIFSSSWGTETTYKRDYCNSLIYTTGVMDIQTKLNAYWLVDNMISYMPEIIKDYNISNNWFYVVEINVNKDNSGFIDIYRECYDDNGEYNEHKTVVMQEIPFIDLPCYVSDEVATYRLFLEITNDSPVQFMLLQPSEH